MLKANILSGLHFELQRKSDGARADFGPAVSEPSKRPSFVLVFNDDWNDYGYRTWFCLYYYDEHGKQERVGEIKLLCRGELNTFEILGESFDGRLDKRFCSLGITADYYRRIHDLFGNTPIANELLVSLRDCAYDQNIYEEFIEEGGFKNSLLREDSSQQAVIEAAFHLGGNDKTAAYSFNLHFAPEYLRGVYTDWEVKLLYDAPPFMRTVGLIGNNGVGKTQMLRYLVKNLIEDVKQQVSMPLFRSCLAISSTPFDEYDKLAVESPRIPYKHFTFEQNSKCTEREIMDCISAILDRPLIYSRSMIDLYIEAVKELLGDSAVGFLIYDEQTLDYKVDREALHKQIAILSSGQLHIFNLVTFIHAHIHLTSLLIIDEPEVHMHPQSVVSFMLMLDRILTRFRSFAIIATHSPLIVREMVGQNVFLMREVDGGIPNVSRVAFETFGADASELFMDIFSYDERMSSFYHYVKRIGTEKGFKEAMEYILKFAPKLSLNARLSIRDCLEEKVE